MSKSIYRVGSVSVYRRKDSGRFRVVWRQGNRNHERSARTLDDAKRIAREIDLADGDAVLRSSCTIAELVVASIAPECTRRWAEGTRTRVEGIARTHITGSTCEFGKLAASRLTGDLVNDFLQGKADVGYSPSLVDQLRKILRLMAKKGMKIGVWTANSNPVAEMVLPEFRDPNAVLPGVLVAVQNVPTKEQVGALEGEFEALLPRKGRFSGGGLLIALAAETGIRQGELFALTKGAFDLEKRTLLVRQAVSRGVGERPIVSRPKTKSAVRTVSYSDALAARLEEFMEDLADTDLVFTGVRGSIWSRSHFGKRFREASRACGFPFDFKSLRHFRATEFAIAGANPHHVAEFMGHANSVTTSKRYQHYLGDAASRLRDLI